MNLFAFRFSKINPRRKHGGILPFVLLIIVGVAVVFSAYYASTLKGSNARVGEGFATEIDGDKALRYKQDFETLEARFNSIHEIKRDKISSEDIDVYDKAVNAFEQYLLYSGIDSRVNLRLDKMRRKLHSLRADKIREHTIDVEARAEELADAKQYAEAEKLFREAAEHERRIETQFASADKRNHARTVGLHNRMLAMQAIPMMAEADELEKEGVAALDAQNWRLANQKLRAALKVQNRLWSDYRAVIPADSRRIATLNRLVETVESSTDYEEVEALRKAAEEAEEKHDWDTAAEIWDKAYRRQEFLQNNFPRSKFAAPERLKNLGEALANTAARPLFLEFRGNMGKIREAIRSRKTENVPILARKNAVIAARLREQFPNNTLLSKRTVEMLAYLDLKSRDIPQIQQAFFTSLNPIPGVSETQRQMTKTEVSQALYTFVAGNNPSANSANPAFPVESISYADVEMFCRRLGAIVGYRVRPPSMEEFRAAAGVPQPEKIDAQAWTLANSSTQIHPCASKEPNEHGFFDLYGNVSEWIHEERTPNEIAGIAVGGDCQTPKELLVEEHAQKSMLKEKSRLRGFRVVIDFDRPFDYATETDTSSK